MKDKKEELIREALSMMLLAEDKEMEKFISKIEDPSPEAKQKMDETFRKIIKKEKTISLKKTIAILIAATFLISIFSITAFAGEKIKDFFVEIFDDHLHFTHEEKTEDDIDVKNVVITYIPEKFENTSTVISDSSASYTWTNDESIVYVTLRRLKNGLLDFDVENANYTTITFENFVVHRTEKYGQITAVWTDGSIVYLITCTGVEWEEMVKIIEGIEYREIEKSHV